MSRNDQFASPEELAKAVYSKIVDLAKFARSVLHLPFADLDSINPSFGVIAKYCDLMVEVLKDSQKKAGTEQKELSLVKEITEMMSDISEGVVERDDQALIDAMCELDEFFVRNR